MVLKDKIALITGSGRGIGAKTAFLLAQKGARVVLMSRSESELEEVAQSIKDAGGQVLTQKGDVSVEGDVVNVFSQIRKTWGEVDIVVNNAAIAPVGKFTELTEDIWQKVYQTNVMGIVYTCRQAFVRMKKKGRGTIVNVSSLGGLERLQKFKGFSAYSMSKFAVVGLSECLSLEGAEFGITVNCIAPGAVDTQMLRQAAPEFATQTRPEDIARSICYLCEEGLLGRLSGVTLPVFVQE